jgi:hypothetical protein
VITAAAQVRLLADAVATSVAAAPLLDEERHPQRIAIVDLPWACPPLITDEALDGGLQDFFDAPVPVTPEDLHRFWVTATRQLWHEPSRLLKNGVYEALGAAMPRAKLGVRAFRFSVPAGAPAQVDESAAVTLALEVAHCARVSFPVSYLRHDDDNYVVMVNGGRFGVENGKPLIPTPFSFDARGQVDTLLRAPRGELTYACHYDQIAAVRSILYSHPDKFKHCFNALDQALQALRYLSLGGYCPELVRAMVVKPVDVQRQKDAEAALYEAIDTIRDTRLNDRSKLATLRNLLVPAAMTVAKYKQLVFSSSRLPFTMAPGKARQIEDNLVMLYKAEVPTGLQRPI